MIYLFYGNDVEKTRRKAFDWVAAARAKEPNLAYAHLVREEMTEAALEDAASAGGLFVKRLLILLDDPDIDLLEERLVSLAASDNAIVVLVPKLPVAKAKKIAAKAAKAYEFNASAARADAHGFNSNLVNALGAKNREKLWLEVVRALRAGDAPEQVHGLLHWKARQMRDRTLSLSLIKIVMDSRRKSLDFAESLEKWALAFATIQPR